MTLDTNFSLVTSFFMFLCILHVALQTRGTTNRRPPLREQGVQCLSRHLYREGRPTNGAQQTGTYPEQITVYTISVIIIMIVIIITTCYC